MLKKLPIVFLVSLLFAGGCASGNSSSRKTAKAILDSRSSSSVKGNIDFLQAGNEVLVTGFISGLAPNSENGLHIHEKGDCTAQDASSAGGHFNPELNSHGSPSGGNRHAGDLPNIKSDMNGNALYTASLSGVSVSKDSKGILGKSLVVHRDPDDYVSQPAGNSGPRIACGVIE